MVFAALRFLFGDSGAWLRAPVSLVVVATDGSPDLLTSGIARSLVDTDDVAGATTSESGRTG